MQPKHTLFIFALCVRLTATSFADTHYVATDGLHVAPYTNWLDAATNVQDAVDAAADGDTVLVANGTYALPSSEITITNGITVAGLNGPEQTIVDGLDTNRCFYIDHTNAVLDGLGITGGRALEGGGVYAVAGTLSNCVLFANWAEHGGGCYGGTVYNCTIRNNFALYYGGGPYDANLVRCLVCSNSTPWRAGGVNGGALRNSAVFGNVGRKVGGVRSATVYNSTIVGNSSKDNGSAAGVDGSAVYNSIVFHNTMQNGKTSNYDEDTSLAYSCTTPEPGGTANITDDPMLVSFSRIASNSPCVAAGSASYAQGTDIDGEAWGVPPSIGCDQVTPGAPVTGQLAVAVAVETDREIAAGTAVGLVACIDGRSYANTWSFGDGAAATNVVFASHAWSATGEHAVVVTSFSDTYPAGVAATALVHVVRPEDTATYVWPDAPGPAAPYGAWSNAAPTIQQAVDAQHVFGGWVWVTNGAYASGGAVTPEGSQFCRVVVTNHMAIKSVGGPDLTVIEGNGPIGSNATRCVYMSRGVLTGFTLSNGCTAGQTDTPHDFERHGGGAYAYGATLTNCTITACAADQYGGGCYYGTLVSCVLTGNLDAYRGGGACDADLRDCVVAGTSGVYGGGLYGGEISNCLVSGNTGGTAGYGAGAAANAVLRDCYVLDNTSSGYGGGIRGGHLSRCVLRGNSAATDGGAAYQASLESCLLAANAAGDDGGGAYESTLRNCTIVGNTATNNGGGTAGGFLSNCIVYDNVASNAAPNVFNSICSYTCTTPDPGGAGNITNAPLFVASNDYHLAAGSPCIDAGTNLTKLTTDLEGNPRPLDGDTNGQAQWDMGCYEFVCPELQAPEPPAGLRILPW